MLKRRVIAAVLVCDGQAVQSIGFRRYLPVGDPAVSVEFFNAWGADEIVLLDITASREGRRFDRTLLARASARSFVPLTVGGGLRVVDDIRAVLEAGADKVSLNAATLEDPDLIGAAADRFGRQCIVCSVDVRRDADGGYEVFADGASRATGREVVTHATAMEAAGAGEILLNAVDRDGQRQGFDVALNRRVADAVSIPVIAISGAGAPAHFADLFRGADVSAGAASNFFNFTEHAITTTKAYLLQSGIDVRLDCYADYRDSTFGDDGRLTRRSDESLEAQFWEHHPPEVI